MLTDVYLHGHLGQKYGEHFVFDIATPAAAAKALAANFKGFAADFRDGFYDVKLGEVALDEEAVGIRLGKNREVHITPMAQGGKRSGGLKAIAGIALLTIATAGASSAALPWLSGTSAIANGFAVEAFTIAGYSVTWGSLAASAGLMFLQGVSGMLTAAPKADYGNRNPVDQRASFLFNGPTNRSADGTPVQLVYGAFKVGSIIASAGITVEQIDPETD